MSGDSSHHQPRSGSLATRMQSDAGISLRHCYQCGKCSAGCPVAGEMDFPPSSILRALQHETRELDEVILRCKGIWLCISCGTCLTRCPKEVDPSRIMDHAREESAAMGLAHPLSQDILDFHLAFLDSVRITGRMSEVVLFAGYKLRSRHFLKDLTLVPSMLSRGKIRILPALIADRASIRSIFERTLGVKRPH